MLSRQANPFLYSSWHKQKESYEEYFEKYSSFKLIKGELYKIMAAVDDEDYALHILNEIRPITIRFVSSGILMYIGNAQFLYQGKISVPSIGLLPNIKPLCYE